MSNPVTAVVDRIRRSYSLKLVLALFVVVVAVAAIGGVIYVQTGSSLQEDTESSMVRSTVLQSESIAGWVDHRRDETRFLASSEAVRSGDENRIRSRLRAELEETDSPVVAIHYVDRSDYTVLASTHDGSEGTSLANAAWATDDLDVGTEPALLDPHDDPGASAPVSGFVAEVPGDDDRLVVLLWDLEALSHSLTKPSGDEESFTHVLNSNGTVVISHHSDRIGQSDRGPNDQHLAVVENTLSGSTGYTELDMDHGGGGGDGHDHGEADAQSDDHEHGDAVHESDDHDHGGRMAMAYAPVEGTDWAVMTHVPADEAFALQQEVTRSVIALIVVSLVGLGLIGAVIGRSTTRELGRLSEKAEELERGDLETELETSRSDEIGRLYVAFASMRDSLRRSIEESEEARRRAERKSEEIATLASHLQTKAEEFRDVMDRAGDGDLTQRMDEDSHNDAMRAIAAEYNGMMQEIERTTTHLKRFADDVATHSEQVTASAEEVESASGQVSESVQHISTSTEQQHEKFRVVSDRMDDISAATEEIATLSDEVTTLAERTSEAGRGGRAAAEDAIEAMERIDEDAEDAVEEMEQLQSQIDRVEQITEFIREVAEQTNMLALNANIEASRSGSGDEGFSVVAEEVKDLANETKSSAEEIEGLVESIQDQTDRTVSEVRTTREDIVTSADTVADAIDALEEIADYARQTHDGTKEIRAASQQQAASTQEVVAMVDEAEALSEGVTDEASTVAAAAEEQTSALSEVTQSAGELSRQARELQRHLDEFETGNDGPQSWAPGDD